MSISLDAGAGAIPEAEGEVHETVEAVEEN